MGHYLSEYGEADTLTDLELEAVNGWLKREFPKHNRLCFAWNFDNQQEFSHTTAFGTDAGRVIKVSVFGHPCEVSA